MSKRIAYQAVVWSVAILGTLWIAAGIAVDLWAEIRPRVRPIRVRVDRKQVSG